MQTEKRFDDPEEWIIAGYVSLAHCVAPLLTMIIVWIDIIKKKDISFWSWETFWILPLPVVTKLQKCIIDFKLYKNNIDRNKVEAGVLAKEYIDKNKEYEKEQEDNQSIVNISVVIEAALESSFQFWFQTVYLMPTIFISFMDVEGEGSK